MNIYTWPEARRAFTSGRFTLQTASLSSRSPFTPTRNTSLAFQFWRADYVYEPARGPSEWQDADAFFARLSGDVNVLRIGDPLRCGPKYNRRNKKAAESWSDNTNWSDGYGWSDGYIPPTAQLSAAVERGGTSIPIEGLIASVAAALSPGDLLELRPGGIATETGNLYVVTVGGATDSNGEIGVEIRPNLRQNFAAGDMVVFRNPQTVMRLTDGEQGVIERESNIGRFGFSCIEHLG